MNDIEQRMAIAEACGLHPGDGTGCGLPDYPNDLNAMHEATMWLREHDPLKYIHYTAAITALVAKFNSDLEDCYSVSAHDATARQRAEAFLRTLGKWKDYTGQALPKEET